jgi:hypothetical protein
MAPRGIGRRSRVGTALAAALITWLPVVAAPLRAGAEELLVMGMGRSLGWLVASETGEVQFRDCQGQLTPAAGSRVEATPRRCAPTPSSVEAVGVVKSVDPVCRVLLVEDDSGRVHGFYVADDGPGAASLDRLTVGRRVRVTGPVPGRAARIVGEP